VRLSVARGRRHNVVQLGLICGSVGAEDLRHLCLLFAQLKYAKVSKET
jgi:hypothetical protein